MAFSRDDLGLGLGAEHDLMRDSIFALNGKLKGDTAPDSHGAARRTLYFVELDAKDEEWRFRLKPQTGFVETRDGGRNSVNRLDAKADGTISRDGGVRWFATMEGSGEIYSEDPTKVQATGGFGGGYDAQELAVDVATKTGVTWEVAERHFLYADIGPSFHHLDPFGKDEKTRQDGGWDTRLFWQYREDHAVHVETSLHYMQISNRQRRFEVQGSYWLLF